MPKNIILLDMDGTITEARKSIDSKMINTLRGVIKSGIEIGIVTGSDIDFIKEQLPLQDMRDLYEQIHFWPCNGSKYYKWNEDALELKYSNDMRDILGEDYFSKIIESISYVHYSNALSYSKSLNLPVTAGFIKFRKSSINYCPIGRDFNQKGREILSEHPENINYRKYLLQNIKSRMETIGWASEKLDLVLGGRISIDIYPKGHGKKFVLSKISKDYIPWFIGDNIGPDGNDYDIYQELVTDSRAFKTSGPEETIDILKLIIRDIGD